MFSLWRLAPQSPAPKTRRSAPRDHFPAETHFFLSVPSGGDLAEGLGQTLVGRILTHSGTHAALAGPLSMVNEQLEQVNAQLQGITGKTLPELLKLLSGEILLSVSGVSPQGIPQLTLSIEDESGEIVGIVRRFQGMFEQAMGVKVQANDSGGVPSRLWPTPLGPVVEAVLGGHVVLTTSPRAWSALAKSYSDGADSGFTASVLVKEAYGSLKPSAGSIASGLDVAWVLNLVEQIAGELPQEVRVILAATGIDHLRRLGGAEEWGGGSAKLNVSATLREGGTGLLSAVAASPGVEKIDELLTVVPKSADSVLVYRYNVGEWIRGAKKVVRASAPQLGGAFDQWLDEMAGGMGASGKALEELGDIAAVTYTLNGERPVPAQITVGATGPFHQYLQLSAGAMGVAGDVERKQSDWKGFRLTEFVGASPQIPGLPPALASLFGSNALFWIDSKEGWTAMAQSREALAEHIESLDGPRLSKKNRKRAALAAGGALSGAIEFRAWDPKPLYEEVLAGLAEVADQASEIGIDLTKLPKASEVISDRKRGIGRLTTSPTRIRLRAGGSAVADMHGLVAASAGGIVAGVLLPSIEAGRNEAHKGRVLEQPQEPLHVQSAPRQPDASAQDGRGRGHRRGEFWSPVESVSRRRPATHVRLSAQRRRRAPSRRR